MAWEVIGNIRGPKGDKGDKGDPGAGEGASTWSEIENKPTSFPTTVDDITADVEIGSSPNNAYLRKDGIWAVPGGSMAQELADLTFNIGDTDYDFLAIWRWGGDEV